MQENLNSEEPSSRTTKGVKWSHEGRTETWILAWVLFTARRNVRNEQKLETGLTKQTLRERWKKVPLLWDRRIGFY